jgi:hypothetical protein
MVAEGMTPLPFTGAMPRRAPDIDQKEQGRIRAWATEAARRTGDYVDADEVVDGLQRKLDAARSRLAKKRK